MRQHEQNKYMLLYAILLFLTANPILSAEKYCGLTLDYCFYIFGYRANSDPKGMPLGFVKDIFRNLSGDYLRGRCGF